MSPVDERGEDYLFSADRFVGIDVPAAVKASLLKFSQQPPLALLAFELTWCGSLPRSASDVDDPNDVSVFIDHEEHAIDMRTATEGALRDVNAVCHACAAAG